MFKVGHARSRVQRCRLLGVGGVQSGPALYQQSRDADTGEQVPHLAVLEKVLRLEAVVLGNCQVEQGIAMGCPWVQNVDQAMDFPGILKIHFKKL